MRKLFVVSIFIIALTSLTGCDVMRDSSEQLVTYNRKEGKVVDLFKEDKSYFVIVKNSSGTQYTYKIERKTFDSLQISDEAIIKEHYLDGVKIDTSVYKRGK